MSNINFTRNQQRKQKRAGLYEGFLVIELLQGLLILGVLLLLISAFHVLSVHWQHQAIKRLEALDLLATELAGFSNDQDDKNHKGIQITLEKEQMQISEFSALVDKPVLVEQKTVTAVWHDERGNQHSIRIAS